MRGWGLAIKRIVAAVAVTGFIAVLLPLIALIVALQWAGCLGEWLDKASMRWWGVRHLVRAGDRVLTWASRR